MRASEIAEDNFEDLLAYDDVLLDYFNAFLCLPVFPKALYYNRLTGTFLELSANQLDSEDEHLSTDAQIQPPFGATDEERERMMQWAKEERLPIFFRTHLFREYKLCHLLLRPLDDRRSGRYNACGSAAIRSASVRGYSRQTESSASSLSNSATNSAKHGSDDRSSTANDCNAFWGVRGMPRRSALFRFQRPGSHAFSLPAYTAGMVRSKSSSVDSGTRIMNSGKTYTVCTTSGNNKSLSRSGTYVCQDDISSDSANQDDDKTADDSQTLNEYTTSSAVSNSRVPPAGKTAKHTENTKLDISSDDTAVSSATEDIHLLTPRGARCDVVYEDDYNFVGDEATQESGAMAGMTFANDDDGMSDAQTEEGVKTLEGKHKMSLQSMKELLLGSVGGMNDFRMFLQSTIGRHLYDFWLDCEFYKDTVQDFDDDGNRLLRTRLFREIQDKYKLSIARDAVQQFMHAANNFGLTQSIFVHTQYNVLRRMRAYWLPRYLLHKEYMNELGIGLLNEVHRRNSINSILLNESIPSGIFPSLSVSGKPSDNEDVSKHTEFSALCSANHRRCLNAVNRCHSLRERFVSALKSEKAGGGPFQLFLQRQEESELLFNLLFWQDITEYEQSRDKKVDRQFRAVHAWDIYNKYIAQDAIFNIGLTGDEQEMVYQNLVAGEDFIDVFMTSKERATDLLEVAWTDYIKQDFRVFLDCHLRTQPNQPNPSDDIEVTFDVATQQLIVNFIKPSSESQHTDEGYLEVDEATRLQERLKRLERRRIMERERRKAIRAAYKRLRDTKLKKTDGETGSAPEATDSADGDKVTFQAAISNKSLLTSFKKHLSDTKSIELLNRVNLFTEIENYNNIESGPMMQKKKEEQAALINRLFLQPVAKRKVHFKTPVVIPLRPDKNRPLTPILKQLQSELQADIDAGFESYSSTDEFNIEFSKSSLKSRSQNSTSQGTRKSRPGSQDFKMYSGDSRQRGHGKQSISITSRIHPTKADKTDFQVELQNAAAGHLPKHMWLFYEFLVHHGEIDGNPRLERDLFFYCEVLKFKEACHAFADEELLRRKVQSVTECYIESPVPNSFQIDIGAETQQKTVKAVQKYQTGKDINSSMFDDAQNSVFKEMLPYWVAFKRNFTPPRDNRPVPLTRLMRERRKKLEEILRWKPPAPDTLILPMLDDAIASSSFTFSISEGFRWRDLGGFGDDRSSVDRFERRLSIIEDEEVVTVASIAGRHKRHSIVSHALSDMSASNILTAEA